MVKIRLSRTGRKNLAHYRVVVADSRAPRDGDFIEILGQYSPLKEKLFELDQVRYNYWVGQGAQPSERIKRLVTQQV